MVRRLLLSILCHRGSASCKVVGLKYLALGVAHPLPQQLVRRAVYRDGRVVGRSFGYEKHVAKLNKEAREIEAVL